ncbi:MULTISPECIES: hypothetical protein [Nonomuraea]|uniref:Uncharacterized protein n=1 Tax=Nonomuraea mangrovi TaxID=2316207 RepID=A0ABW4T194_9ACTN
MLRSDLFCGPLRESYSMYKEFAAEAVVWVVPIVVLIGLALMITA